VSVDDKVGIWIDHKKAVIVSASAGRVTAKTLESEVGPHGRYSGREGYPTPDGPQSGGGEKKYEDRHGQHLDRYYDDVISHIGQPSAILIFGRLDPGAPGCPSRPGVGVSNGTAAVGCADHTSCTRSELASSRKFAGEIHARHNWRATNENDLFDGGRGGRVNGSQRNRCGQEPGKNS
jgi:hypothetical protein